MGSANICDLDPATATVPANWSLFQKELYDQQAKGMENQLHVETFGSLATDAARSKWGGGVLAPNGKIYGIPYESPSVLEIDPKTSTTRTFGSLGEGAKWWGGALAPNGKIYGIPFGTDKVLEIDPERSQTRLFGSVGESRGDWAGGVLGPNGKVYGIPRNASQVLEIDPCTLQARTFGSLEQSGGKWSGGVLAPNGKIFGIPLESPFILMIDPETRAVETFGSLEGPLKKADDRWYGKWYGGVLAANGNIYGIPRDARQVLEIDPQTRRIETFGDLPRGKKWLGGALAPNGRIYGIGYASVLEVDPSTRQARLLGSVPYDESPEGMWLWVGGVLDSNGRIYGIPCCSSAVLQIDRHSKGAFCAPVLLSGFLNKGF